MITRREFLTALVAPFLARLFPKRITVIKGASAGITEDGLTVAQISEEYAKHSAPIVSDMFFTRSPLFARLVKDDGTLGPPIPQEEWTGYGFDDPYDGDEDNEDEEDWENYEETANWDPDPNEAIVPEEEDLCAA